MSRMRVANSAVCSENLLPDAAAFPSVIALSIVTHHQIIVDKHVPGRDPESLSIKLLFTIERDLEIVNKLYNGVGKLEQLHYAV